MKACKSLKSVLMITAAAFGATGAATIADRPAWAQEAVRTYAIPAQDLDGALRAFAMQTGRDVLYAPGIVSGRSSPGARGSFTERQALSAILAGTGLTVQVTASQGYAIVDPNRPSQDAGRPGQDLRSDLGAERTALLPEVLVEGGRSLNTDVRRTEDDILPYVVFGRGEIQQSQAANIEDFLRLRLPMATDRGTAARNEILGSSTGNRSSINLRGLGANQTLILVNGRRMPGVRTGGGADFEQPDVNGIPIASIERIEVLPASASGIYGGGATGGVINIILRKDYSGTQVQLTYDNTFETDSARRRVDVSSGFSLEGGRTQIMLSGSYADANDLWAQDRNFIGRARELLRQNDPTHFALNANLSSIRTNFRNRFGVNLTLRDGTPFGSYFGSVPVGYAGGDNGAGLLAGAGAYDLRLPNGPAGRQQSLSAVPETQALNLTIRRDMTEAIDAYLDLSATRSRSATRQGATLSTVNLAAGAAGNPFREAVQVQLPDPGMDTASQTETTTQRVNGGAIIDLSHGWTANLDVNWNRATNAFDSDISVVDAILLRNAVRAGEINPFRDLNQFPIDYSPYLGPRGTLFPTSPTYTTDYALRAAGPLFTLPAGQVRMTTLASHRRDEMPGFVFDQGVDFGAERYGYYHPRTQVANSVYVETLVPLFSEAQNVFLLHSLEAQLSARWDRYETTTSHFVTSPSPDGPRPAPEEETNILESTDYTVGLKYMPAADLTVRASYTTGFLAPSLNQLLGFSFEIPMIFADPMRGDTASFTPMTFLSGGNPDAKPEESISQSVGLIYSPRFIDGLRLSVDFVRIEKTDELTVLDPSEILQNELLFPGRVVRGENLPDDPPGWAGVVTTLDVSLINASNSLVEATDFQVDYQRDLGDLGWFKVYAVGSVQSRMERRATASGPVIDRVGFSDGPGRLRFNVGVDWLRGPWTLTLNTQYYDDYKVFTSIADPSIQADLSRRQGSSTIPSQTYTDISARYDFGSGWWNGTQLTVGVRNVFNQEPPLVATGDLTGGYSTFGDPRLRTYTVSVRKSF